MNTTSIVHLWRAETRKLSTRFVVKLSLVVQIGLALIIPLAVFAMAASGMGFGPDQTVADVLPQDAPHIMSWTLSVRHFFIMQAFFILVTAQTFAGEHTSKTLRESMLRPVTRTSLLLAKWLALSTWCAGLLLTALVLSSLTGAVLFGVGTGWQGVLLGYLATFAVDITLCALTLMFAVFSRSVAMTVAGMFLFYIFDKMLAWFLFVTGGIFKSLPPEFLEQGYGGLMTMGEWMLAAGPWLPSSAFDAWAGYQDVWMYPSFVTLFSILALSLLASLLRFRRMDIL